MKGIMRVQGEIQRDFSKKAGKMPPQKFNGFASKKDVLDYIHQHAYFLNEEVSEILNEVAGSRDAVKPWHEKHVGLENKIFVTNDRVKDEACDMLAFCINIMLACGITPDDVEDAMSKTHGKVLNRLARDELSIVK